jgi:hypothetical protein
MPFQFPDPSVSTTATLPNGEQWEYVNDVWQSVRLIDNDQVQINALQQANVRQDTEIDALEDETSIDRGLLVSIASRLNTAEVDIDSIKDLDITTALSALAIAQQDIIDLKSKVNTLELTSFLILE